MKYRIYIYCIYFPTSNKYYVGQTNNLTERLNAHLSSKYLVGNALQKYNDWQVTILHTVKTRNAANLLEIEEIRNLNSVAPNGYNLIAGGEGHKGKKTLGMTGRKHKEESKKKMSKSHKGRKNPIVSDRMKKNNPMKNPKIVEKVRIANIGCKRSAETCAKISKSCKGRKNPEVSERNKHPEIILRAKISNLKRYIIKLEQKLND